MGINRGNARSAAFEHVSLMRQMPNPIAMRARSAMPKLVKAPSDIPARVGDTMYYANCKTYEIDNVDTVSTSVGRAETNVTHRVYNPHLFPVKQNEFGLAIPIEPPGFFLWCALPGFLIRTGKTVEDILPGQNGDVELYYHGLATGTIVSAELPWCHGNQQISAGKEVYVTITEHGWTILCADCETEQALQVGD